MAARARRESALRNPRACRSSTACRVARRNQWAAWRPSWASTKCERRGARGEQRAIRKGGAAWSGVRRHAARGHAPAPRRPQPVAVPAPSRQAPGTLAIGDAFALATRALRARWRMRAASASAGVHSRRAGSIAMQSTGQGATHSSQPEHSDGRIACMRFCAPMIASTGQASMHSVQPMHAASSMTATSSGPCVAARRVERLCAPGRSASPRRRRRHRRRAGNGRCRRRLPRSRPRTAGSPCSRSACIASAAARRRCAARGYGRPYPAF